MSLTPQAYHERKLGSFPALRKALEDKKIPPSYYGFTSVSDNIFDSISRLVEMAVLISEYEDVIKETAELTGRKQMERDLRHVEDAFCQAARFFQDTISKIQTLNREF